MHRARAARPCEFDSLPSQDPDRGRFDLALWRDEVQILIFDDPAEL
jgi:hypothetical protein